MNNLKNTIIEENLPILRRKSFDTLKKFVKNKICDTLRAFPDHLHLEKISLKESEEAINTHFQKIHTIIDAIDYHITKRLVNHEN